MAKPKKEKKSEEKEVKKQVTDENVCKFGDKNAKPKFGDKDAKPRFGGI